MDADKMISSVQFNYEIDLDWLISKYPASVRHRPLLVVTQATGTNLTDMRTAIAMYNEERKMAVTMVQARLPIAYGTHHTKMMILKYTDGVRVVIHTANLIREDWDQKTEGIYITPLMPKLDDGASNGSAEFSFKHDLVDYLRAYKLPPLDTVANELSNYDMSEVKVKLVASVPGRFQGAEIDKWGLGKLRALLMKYIPSSTVQKSWPIVAQFSSIGSLGPTPEHWLLNEFSSSFGAANGQKSANPSVQLVFPSVENVRASLEGYSAGRSLPYHSDTAQKQKYLKDFLHQWKSDSRGRTRASPHIKTYFRVSPCVKKLGWFLLTSANLSKAAWGSYEKNGSQLMVRSYELGVLFLPQQYGKDHFDVIQPDEASADVAGFLRFPLPIDLPLVPYGPTDEPWIANISYRDKKDSHGRFWR